MDFVNNDMLYFRSLQNGIDKFSKKEIIAGETKRRIARDMLTSINLETDTTRNGIPQQFVVTTTEQVDKMDILAFPDEELLIGDLIWCYGKYWIVKEVYATNILQAKGKMICCNLDLNFQVAPSASVYTRHVCIDSGVYSTTQKSQPELSIPDQQYKMYAQIDDEIMNLYVGRRIAVGKWIDEDGKNHLLCYRITAVDPVSLNFYNGHIVEFKLRSDLDDPIADNLDLLICNYIPIETRNASGGW